MFLAFIQKSKLSIGSDKLKWLVMGNEAGDLDSLVSSLVYAHLKQKKLGNDCDVIPVCCASKTQIQLRKDVVKWLRLFDIDCNEDIVYLDDIKSLLCHEQNGGHLQISLVDHHKPQLPVMAPYVREIIDHRSRVCHYPEGQLHLDNVELVGSCCTLIVDYLTEETMIDDRDVMLKMLHGPILLDTNCLSIYNNKTTERDVRAIELIETLLGIDMDTRKDVYRQLAAAKYDTSGFSMSMMINRDLKILEFEWNNTHQRMAIPSLINVDVEDLLAIDDLEIQFGEILKSLNASIIICLTCGTEYHKRRGYLIFSYNCELNERISDYMLRPEHGLYLQSMTTGTYTISFYQNNLGTSRKQFIPIIEKMFNCPQFNHCNCETYRDINLIIKTNYEGAPENEGASNTLKTPLRISSDCPDDHNLNKMLSSLTNRHSLEVVDQEHLKTRAEVKEERSVEEEIQNSEKDTRGEGSPLTFMLENSDDDSKSQNSNGSNSDNVGPLPSPTHFASTEQMTSKKKYQSEHENIKFISESATATNDANVSSGSASGNKSKKFSKFKDRDIIDTKFVSLAEKVSTKIQKSQSVHINSIACALVKDIMNRSQNIVAEEIDFEYLLNDWSNGYSEEDKRQIVNYINSNDMDKLSQLLTFSLIQECLNAHESPVSAGEKRDSVSDSDNNDGLNVFETSLPNLENSVINCHMGNIINEENQCILAGSVNSSSADVVENISFNLYRRISTNQLDYSAEEKELLITAGDWLPKEDVIYSDPEYEEHYDNDDDDDDDYLNPNNDGINAMSRKIATSDENMYVDKSRNSY